MQETEKKKHEDRVRIQNELYDFFIDAIREDRDALQKKFDEIDKEFINKISPEQNKYEEAVQPWFEWAKARVEPKKIAMDKKLKDIIAKAEKKQKEVIDDYLKFQDRIQTEFNLRTIEEKRAFEETTAADKAEMEAKKDELQKQFNIQIAPQHNEYLENARKLDELYGIKPVDSDYETAQGQVKEPSNAENSN
jgi:hypothetical protein